MRYAIEMLYMKTAEEREKAIKEKNNYQFTYGKMYALFWYEIITAEKKSILSDILKLLENMSRNFHEQLGNYNYNEQQL
jgi:hypothetical protein